MVMATSCLKYQGHDKEQGAIRKYLFSDESGDLQCRRTPNVSKYFAVGTLIVDEPQLKQLRTVLSTLRDELAWRSHGLDSCFHTTTDKQHVREQVFTVLAHLDFRFDVTLLEKSKAQPQVRSNEERFFQYAWFYHWKYLAPRAFSKDDEVLVVAAELGTKKKRNAFRLAIEEVLKQSLDYRVKRTLAFWRDDSDFALHAVDYLTWAVMRYYERGDDRSFNQIAHKINPPFDLFYYGQTHYY